MSLIEVRSGGLLVGMRETWRFIRAPLPEPHTLPPPLSNYGAR
jgi:hypothetical protein